MSGARARDPVLVSLPAPQGEGGECGPTCSRARGPCARHNTAVHVHFISCTEHDLKIADLCFVKWVQYNAPRDLAARFLDASGTAPVRKRSIRALPKE